MGLSSSKTKTKSTASSTPLDQYAPYITNGLTNAQGVLNDNQANLQSLGTKAMDVYGSMTAPQATLGSLYAGTNPAQSAYTSLNMATANDPSLGMLKKFADPSVNPASDMLSGLVTSAQNNPASDTLSSISTGSANPFVDSMVQQGQNDAIRAANVRFANAGMGEGVSTPYMDVLSKNVSDAGNKVRYQAYNDNAGRQLQAAQSLGSLYNEGQQNATAAATNLGSQHLAGQQQGLSAAQALGQQQTADHNTELNATNGNIQSILSALGLSGQMSAEQLQALAASASLPFTGVGNFANIVNGLTAKYGNQTGTSTSTTSGNVGQMLGGLAGSALSGWATGGFK